MIETTAEVKNAAGIHVRPSGLIIGELNSYPGKIIAESNGFSVELNSVMALLSLGLVQGDTVRLKIEGPDEEEYAKKVVELFQRHYDFPPK